MQVPAGVGPDRFNVAVVAPGFAAEQIIAALRRRRIEAASGRLRGRNRQLIELEVRQLRRDLVVVRADVRQVAEAVRRSYWKLRRVVEPRIEESSDAMHLQVGDERV